MPELSSEPTPYATGAALYWRAGWRGILPLPPRRKVSPPKGWTGELGEWPSYADVQAWIDGGREDGNIALRLPEDVVGIDVDNYGAKRGMDTLEAAIEQYGPLPETWLSTSRSEGSGIRFYRVPPQLRWRDLGPDVETIWWGYRYAVAWPSIHPDTGNLYRWLTPDGVPSIEVPRVEQFAELPALWVAGLQGRVEKLETISGPYGDGTDRRLTAYARAVLAAETVRMLSTDIGSGMRNPALYRAAIASYRAFLMAGLDLHEVTNTLGEADGGLEHPATRQTLKSAWEDAVEKGPSTTPEPRDLSVTVLDGTIAGSAAPGEVPTPYQLALDAEVLQQRLRLEARKILTHEEAVKSFREPEARLTLTQELEIVDDSITFTVDQVMPTGANVLLAAQYKAGKTTLTNHLVRCLADGDQFLGTFPVSPPAGRIAIFNYEVDERQYRRWLRELGVVNTDAVTVLNLRGYRLPMITPYVEDWIVKWLLEREVAVWMVDPFARAYVGSGTSENDNTEVGRFLDTLDVIKARAGVSDLVMPTHTGRAEFEEGQERARGATRLDDWADVRWMLTKDQEDTRYFSATGRDVDAEEVSLKFDERTRGLRVAGGSRAKESKTRLSDAIMSVVHTTPGIKQEQLRVAVRQIVGKVGNDILGDEITTLQLYGRLRIDHGPHSSKLHFPVALATSDGGPE